MFPPRQFILCSNSTETTKFSYHHNMALFTKAAETMGALPQKYEPLTGQQDDEATQQDSLVFNFPRDRRTLRLKIIGLGFCLGILVATFLILIVVGLILSSVVTHIYPAAESHCAPGTEAVADLGHTAFGLQKTGPFTCGENADEARALGCIWDVMNFAWEHPDCYDAELVQEFEALGPWTFYHSSRADTEVPESNMLSVIPDDQVGDHLELMWTDRRYHSMHCIFAAKLVHRAVERGGKVQGKLASINHTNHCAMSLQNRDKEAVRWMERYHTVVPLDAIVTRATVQYPTC
ncbi:uncharacterized protein LY89DRAFT_208026 [Mollisia scopiformis]|uniref:Uncharacterized protein n=1 Tax=Mollisia scopiformis TaxID=149040 RepID=A0A194WXQ3_MOLSC|nr:uncharacterized protein LY89DRAFT_208026 [Mollisia scopiformis]KUJ12459.1 hypothetical protein LY89DRAFT_208026 [Mollisia scopiformis]